MIVVGGYFTGLGLGTGAILRQNIGRVDTDGVVDLGFNPGAEAQVNSLGVQVDGRIVAGGYFKWVGAAGGASRSTRNYIARLDPDGAGRPDLQPGRGQRHQRGRGAGGRRDHHGRRCARASAAARQRRLSTARNRIARFAATDAAVQTLTLHRRRQPADQRGVGAQRRRPGSVARTTFAFSFDGSFYSVARRGHPRRRRMGGEQRS